MKQGFTLLEVVIVIIIISILVTLGIIQYNYMMERFRKLEAKISLGQLREAEVAYFQDRQEYSGIQDLGLKLPSACDSEHYFFYSCRANDGRCCADRCVSGSGGKSPNAPEDYQVCLTIDANFSQTGYGVP